MGDEIINLFQEKILKLLAEQWKGLTTDEICHYNSKKKLELLRDDLDIILEEMESLGFLRSGDGERKRWLITMKGLCTVGGNPHDMWP